MSDKYFIGLDGGGTKTKCVITDYNLNVLFQCSGGPSNFLIIGTGKVSETILKLITTCTEKMNVANEKLEAVLIGTTGAGRVNDANKLKKSFDNYVKSNNINIKNFFVESDARIALEGAFSGSAGSILIAGTGSIMYGKNRKGDMHRVGGFGRYIGDEGSGNCLGRMGLNAVAKVFDGRMEDTSLVGLVADKFNITNTQELITEVYSNDFPLADVAPLVIEAAENNDSICLEIINSNIDELILHIKAMHKKLDEKILKLSFIGGTITTSNFYSKKFREKITNSLPYVKIQSPELEPAIGAALLAKAKLA